MAKKKKRGSSFIIFLLVCVIAFFGGKIAYDATMEFLYPKKYSEYVEKYASEYGISETLLYSVIRTESGFDPDSVSVADAIGLTQITEDTFDWLIMKSGEDYTFDDLFTPEISIKYGCHLYGYLMKKYKNEETALAAYHAGVGNADKWLKDERYSADGKSLHTIPFPSTAQYVKKVIKTKNIYEKLYDRKDA